MNKINKTNSQIRTEKEKLVMENFASVMKKLDTTFLVEGTNTHLEEKYKRLAPKLEEFKSILGDKLVELPYVQGGYGTPDGFSDKSKFALSEIDKGSDKVYVVTGYREDERNTNGEKWIVLLNMFTSPQNEELIRTKLSKGGSQGSSAEHNGVSYFRIDF